jgi:hypothetical protein
MSQETITTESVCFCGEFGTSAAAGYTAMMW